MKGQTDLITCGDNGDSVVQADFRLILISMNTHKSRPGLPGLLLFLLFMRAEGSISR